MGKSIDPMLKQKAGSGSPAYSRRSSVSMSLQPAIPRLGALQQCPPPLHRPASECYKVVLSVNLYGNHGNADPSTSTARQHHWRPNRKQNLHLSIGENCPNNRDHRSIPMARKAGQIVERGASTWLVRVYLGRDPQTGTRKYLNQTIHGPFREAQRFLNLKLQQRDNGRVSRATVMSLNHLLDQWLTSVVKARVRARSFGDYEALLRLHIRPVLGSGEAEGVGAREGRQGAPTHR